MCQALCQDWDIVDTQTMVLAFMEVRVCPQKALLSLFSNFYVPRGSAPSLLLLIFIYLLLIPIVPLTKSSRDRSLMFLISYLVWVFNSIWLNENSSLNQPTGEEKIMLVPNQKWASTFSCFRLDYCFFTPLKLFVFQVGEEVSLPMSGSGQVRTNRKRVTCLCSSLITTFLPSTAPHCKTRNI